MNAKMLSYTQQLVADLAKVNPAYELIAIALDNEGLGVVLVKRDDKVAFPNAPYATWGFCTHSGLHTGHYDMDEEAAREDFARRVGRVM